MRDNACSLDTNTSNNHAKLPRDIFTPRCARNSNADTCVLLFAALEKNFFQIKNQKRYNDIDSQCLKIMFNKMFTWGQICYR